MCCGQAKAHYRVVTGLAAISVLLSAAQDVARAQRPYDGIQAGVDAYRLGEEKRQAAIGQQVYLNDRMRAWATPLAVYNGYYGNGTFPYTGNSRYIPASREYAYAYGTQAAYGYGVRPRTVFEPWPYVAGDIYGDVYLPPQRQSVGQIQVQTGPNRWESHPVYDPPVTPYLPTPPVASVALDKTPYAIRRETAPEAPAPGPAAPSDPSRSRRREF